MQLQIDQITKKYDSKIAVDRLSLTVPPGELYGIIGPNGAGKTTTLRMVMNIIMPDSGKIMFGGKEIDSEFKDVVGYLPEERGLYKKMTLNEVIVYMAELKGVPSSTTKKRIDKWLERMNLTEYRDKKVEELSKGMAQKLQFITTVIHDPQIIILDELFSGLDPVNIELIKNILLELKRSGKTILFSTHVMEQAEKLCDSICMISRGQKVIDGKMNDIKHQFGQNAIQVELSGDGSFIKSLPEVKDLTAFNNYYEIQLHDNSNSQSLLKSISDKVDIRRFEIVEPSLYDIFIKVAKEDVTPQTETVGDVQ